MNNLKRKLPTVNSRNSKLFTVIWSAMISNISADSDVSLNKIIGSVRVRWVVVR